MDGRDIAILCAKLCEEFKGEDILILDLRGLTDVTDCFVIASFASRAQIKAAAEAIQREAKARKVTCLGVEGTEAVRWILIDFVDCVVHLFDPDVRRYYELETLWGDAPQVLWDDETIGFQTPTPKSQTPDPTP